MKLSDCMHPFFDHYLLQLKGASKQTIDSYRDAFTLLLPFAANIITSRSRISSFKIFHSTLSSPSSTTLKIRDITVPELEINAWPPSNPSPK